MAQGLDVKEQFIGPAIPIAANDGKRHWFYAEFSVLRPNPGFHVQNFGQPTIGFTLRIRETPPGYKVTASPADKQAGDDLWIYSGVFMPQEHIQIRWEKE